MGPTLTTHELAVFVHSRSIGTADTEMLRAVFEERDELRTQLAAVTKERDDAIQVIRDASYRLKTPFMGGEHIRNAKDVLEDFMRTVAKGPLPEDFDFRMEKRCLELAAERDSRPDAATVAKVVALIRGHEEVLRCAAITVNGDLAEALKLLEAK